MSKPCKGDTVIDYDGTVGTINSVSKGYAYVDFGHKFPGGTGRFDPNLLTWLVPDGHKKWKVRL